MDGVSTSGAFEVFSILFVDNFGLDFVVVFTCLVLFILLETSFLFLNILDLIFSFLFSFCLVVFGLLSILLYFAFLFNILHFSSSSISFFLSDKIADLIWLLDSLSILLLISWTGLPYNSLVKALKKEEFLLILSEDNSFTELIWLSEDLIFRFKL